MKSLSFVIFAMAVAVTCSGCGKVGTPCGAGTIDREGRCVAEIICGTGTVNVGGTCVREDPTVCGAGTVNVGGKCVPDGSRTACGAGTVIMGGQCVPDGSIICAQGTVFNPATSHCDVDPSACGPGTAFLNGGCVPESDPHTVDFEETAEPNDESGAGHFDAPAIGEAVTIHGCITPVLGTADIDNWVITASGPTLLEITADGVHGLAAAFAVKDGSYNPKLANWQRLGLNLTGDTSRRQVFLPAAGDYLLRMNDSRALILDGTAVGGADTCYFGTIKRVALPVATALLPTMSGQDSGKVQVLSFDATARGDLLYLAETPTSVAIAPGFVVMRQGALAGVAISDSYYVVGGLEPTNDHVEIVIDNVINYGITPQTYTLTSLRIQSQALPTDGATVSMRHDPHGDAIWEQHYFYFDVAEAGQLVHFDIQSGLGMPSPLGVNMMFVRRDIIDSSGSWDSIAKVGFFLTRFQGFIRFDQPGRYYFVDYDHWDVVTGAYDTTSTLTNMTITPVTYGTPMAAQTITAQGSTFYSYHVGANQQWAELSVLAEASWRGGQALVRLYDLGWRGWFADGFPGLSTELQAGTQPPDGMHPIQRVVLGEPHDYLIRVQDTFSPTGPPTFTLDIKEHPGFVDLGTIAVGTPIQRTGMDNIPPGGMVLYLVKSSANDRLHVEVTPDPAIDMAIDRLYPDGTSRATANSGGQGAAETMDMIFPGESPQWVAFAVRNLSATTSSPTLSLTTSASPFSNICDATTVLPAPFDGNAENEFTAIQTLPPGFTFYGVPVPTFFVNANGFLSFAPTEPICSGFEGCDSNSNIPFAPSPNNIIAAYWDDLRDVRVCRKDDAVNHAVTIQWSGRLRQDPSPVEVQAVLHQNGQVDFHYGDQQADGSFATVGVENASGTVGKQLSTPGSITPGLSLSVTTP
jgi:hypothetical protein